jgi:hypothetical protein
VQCGEIVLIEGFQHPMKPLPENAAWVKVSTIPIWPPMKDFTLQFSAHNQWSEDTGRGLKPIGRAEQLFLRPGPEVNSTLFHVSEIFRC